MHSLLVHLKKYGPLLLIVLLAIVLRGFKLGEVPQGITWDEAAIGYNGYAIVTTRRDEWLQRLPVSFQSFGDYKAPLAIYLSGIFTTLLQFGLSPWAIRLPFFLSGVAAVIGMFFLTEVMLQRLGQKAAAVRWSAALMSSFLLCISPWHLHFTRTGFESGIALTLVIWGAFGWIKAITTKQQIWWWLSVISFVASLYAYHSAKMTVPLVLVALTLMDLQSLWQQRRQLLVPAVLGAALLWPLLSDALWGHGLERAGTLILSKGLSPMDFWRLALENIRTQLGFSFWFQGATNTLRHGDGVHGVLYWWDGVALLGGGLMLIKTALKKQHSPLHALAVWGLVWIFLGLAPAILATEVPHPNRALLALIGVVWLCTASWVTLAELLDRQRKLLFLGVFALGYLISLGQYQWYYYTVYPKTGSEAFFDGYFKAAQRAVYLEKHSPNQTSVSKVLFTSDYGQPYIFILLARKTNPIWYQGGSLAHYEFSNQITSGDLNRGETLVVASATDELPNARPDEIITDAAGIPRFKIFYPHQTYE